ncbi:hypothetical protein [Candidatus Nitrosocosmicus sp. SS]|uniref:hypothetical protein n=1 Tax=Candidatus Nitrosocosmicus agrestis TaxID=2563600 RepID=UPI0012B595D1|nr:hypothetical protein [Candidatus Nitrosocosmicus sp. SS]
MPRKYFIGETEQDVKSQINEFLFAFNVNLISTTIKELAHSWEGCIDYEDPYGEFTN